MNKKLQQTFTHWLELYPWDQLPSRQPLSVEGNHVNIKFLQCNTVQCQSKKKKENICRSNAQITFEFYDHFRCLQIDPLFQAITTFTKYCLTQWISKLPGTLSDTVFGKFHEFDGHSKRSGLQDRATFHKASALQIAIIFNTAVRYNTVQHDATRFNTIRRINTSNQYKAILRNNTIQYYETIQYIQHSTTQYNTCN